MNSQKYNFEQKEYYFSTLFENYHRFYLIKMMSISLLLIEDWLLIRQWKLANEKCKSFPAVGEKVRQKSKNSVNTLSFSYKLSSGLVRFSRS